MEFDHMVLSWTHMSTKGTQRPVRHPVNQQGVSEDFPTEIMQNAEGGDSPVVWLLLWIAIRRLAVDWPVSRPRPVSFLNCFLLIYYFMGWTSRGNGEETTEQILCCWACDAVFKMKNNVLQNSLVVFFAALQDITFLESVC